ARDGRRPLRSPPGGGPGASDLQPLSAAPNPSPHASEGAREIGREAMTDCPVLITGARADGLLLALLLTRLGVRVRIIDKAAEPGTTSRAVAVTARTLELYQQLDLAGAVVEAGVQVAAANLWVGGAKAAHLPLGRIGEGLSPFPYALTYPQDAHERLLIERLNALGTAAGGPAQLVRFRHNPPQVRALRRRAGGTAEGG